MAGVSVTGNKKIATLQKEFNEQFPYLILHVGAYVDGEVRRAANGNETLASIRRGNGTGKISITGNKKISSLQNEFKKEFGICAYVSYRDKNGMFFYAGGTTEYSMTLSAFNEKCKKNKCKKGVWK